MVGNPEAGGEPQLGLGRNGEVARHHAHHWHRLPVEGEHLPQHPGIGVELPPPQPLGDDRLPGAHRERLVEGAAEQHTHREHPEEAGAGHRAGDALGSPAARGVQTMDAPGGGRGEGLRRPGEIRRIASRQSPGQRPVPEGAFPGHHHPIRIGEGQRSEEHRVHQGEEGGVGSQSKPEGQNRQGGRPAGAKHRAEGRAEVSHRGCRPQRGPCQLHPRGTGASQGRHRERAWDRASRNRAGGTRG